MEKNTDRNVSKELISITQKLSRKTNSGEYTLGVEEVSQAMYEIFVMGSQEIDHDVKICDSESLKDEILHSILKI